MTARPVVGTNDPRFQGTAFLETIAISAAAGGITGYITGWEAYGLLKGAGILSPATLWAAIHALGILPPAAAPILAGGVALGLVLGALVGCKVGDIAHEVHVRGLVLHSDPKRLRKVLKTKKRNRGVSIHPQIPISEQQECRHILTLGGSGSGKTSILWALINQSVARGDRVLIFSFKGDFQQKAPFAFDLLGPWDSRSARWAIGQDIQTRLDAESLAMTLIPEQEKDPVWSQGAQGLLVAVIASVQRKYGQHWGFPHLAEKSAKALSDYNFLLETVKKESPLARSFLMGHDSKTTASFLAQMASRLSQVVNIGVGDDSNNNSLWSVSEWLSGKARSAAIIGYLPSAKALSRAYCSSIIEQVTRQVLDMPDCSPDKRRIWLFLDEVPQIGKVPSITELLEAARSKGVRVVLGMQSVAQVEELYSKNTMRVWSGQCSIKIIAALTEPADQKWSADLVGEREVDRYVGTQNVATGSQGSSQGGSYQRAREHVLMPSEFGQVLHVIEEKGPRALLLAPGAGAILDWPFPAVREQRQDRVPAPWTMPGFERPTWGAVPPQVAEPTQGAEADTSVTRKEQEQEQQIVVIAKDSDRQEQSDAPDVPGAADVMLDAMIDHLLPGVSLIKDMVEQMQTTGPAIPLPTVAPANAVGIGEEEEEREEEGEM